MADKETKAYIQELADKDGNKIYPVTKAEATYMSDNKTTVEQKVTDMQQSFQDGVDTLVNKLKSLGVTPEENSPAGIAAALDVLAQNKFNDGVASIKIPATVSITTNGGAGQENYDITDGYYTEAVVDQSGAYNAGRLQGREDVKSNPNGYGFYTGDQYNAFGNSKFSEGYAAGKVAVKGSVSTNCSWGNDSDGGGGTRAATSGSASATATIENGRLTISVSGSSSGTAWRWIDGGWTSEHSTGASGNRSNASQVA